MTVRVITAPEPWTDPTILVQRPERHEIPANAATLFLAGPIQSTGDWQAEAISHIKDIGPRPGFFLDTVIANPRRPTPNGMGDFTAEMFTEQVDWEHYWLRCAAHCGVTLFWLANETFRIDGRAYGQTTRLELGEAMSDHIHTGRRFVVGIDSAFSGRTYIRYTLGKKAPGIPVADSLRATCELALQAMPTTILIW